MDATESFEYMRRACHEVDNVGGKLVPVVVHTLRPEDVEPANLFGAGYRYSVPLDKWNLTDAACDVVYTQGRTLDFELPGTLTVLMDATAWEALDTVPARHQPLWDAADAWDALPAPKAGVVHWVKVKRAEVQASLKGRVSDAEGKMRQDVILVIETDNAHYGGSAHHSPGNRRLGLSSTSGVRRTWSGLDDERLALHAATDGWAMIDGLGDGIWIDA